jgi:hypothetical protein
MITLIIGFGYLDRIGTTDFYINGGAWLINNFSITRVTELYISIRLPTAWLSLDKRDIKNGRCRSFNYVVALGAATKYVIAL